MDIPGGFEEEGSRKGETCRLWERVDNKKAQE